MAGLKLHISRMQSKTLPIKPAIEGVAHRLPLVLLVGPTAVGKTEIALQLAEHLGGEIVSADSRLFYRGMDIGTAKPTREERSRVPHHLIDIASPDETLSLSVFQQKAQLVISDIHLRGKLPLLVGGTGQYVRAVTQDWRPPPVKPDIRLRAQLEKLKEDRGKEWLHAKLESLDPKAAENIDGRNVRRTIRALEVILKTGRKFSELRGQGATPYHLLTIGLTRPRAEIYARIDTRIEAMFQAGLLDEVNGLLAKGVSPEMPTMSAIGYRECVKVIEGQWSLDEAKVVMQHATHLFVRRQANWFKETDPNIRWFYAGEEGVLQAIESFIRDALRE
jgi:tRNA dimethylallyltransferase